MMGLLQFATSAAMELDNINNGKDFARRFVELKSCCFRTYQHDLVTSNSHGLDFFHNIVKYWDHPEAYAKPPEKKSDVDYEWNFVLVLRKNKE